MEAPEGLRGELIGVPAGARIELEFRLEAVMDGVLVTGTVRAPLTGECARCLDPLTSQAEVDFQELFRYADAEFSDDPEAEEHRMEGTLLDLEPVVRDAVVLALPLSPVCRESCPGLCPQCGARLADVGPAHRHDAVDPRWTALRGLVARPDGDDGAYDNDTHDDQEG